MEQTIAAVSTAIGMGGIAIIRISGTLALEIADSIFVSSHGKPSQFSSHTIHYGKIVAHGVLLDQVMLTVLRTPHTYTTEDTVEINCHGGLTAARSILNLCLEHGARMAEPGEFTKRAFLNGRIDLTQAEAVMDLIQAHTERSQTAAANALEGNLLRRILASCDQLSNILAHLEAHFDFPEEEIPPTTREQLILDVEKVIKSVRELLATAQEGQILRDGVQIAILGRPNVGKSSLMNALLGRDRSIVTPIPGTTRDTVEDALNINGIRVRLIDTAGFRKGRGVIEKTGIARSHNALEASQMILHVMDISKPYSGGDFELNKRYRTKPVIYVYNKVDMKQKLKIPHCVPIPEGVMVSALNGHGIADLKERIGTTIWSGKIGHDEIDVTVNSRHADSLRLSLDNMLQAIHLIGIGEGNEVVSQHFRFAINALREITGSHTSNDLLDRIFSRFCIGK